MSTPHSLKVYIALGNIVAIFSTLEQIVYMAISAITEIRFDLCLSMFAGNNFDALIKILDSVHGEAITKIKPTIKSNQEFQSILNILRDVNKRRNTYFHSQWHVTENPELTIWKWVKGKKGKSVQTNSNKITVDDLNKLVKDIGLTCWKLQTFYTKYFIKQDE